MKGTVFRKSLLSFHNAQPHLNHSQHSIRMFHLLFSDKNFDSETLFTNYEGVSKIFRTKSIKT
jgi:hypothetical protein